ncbi:MAG: hypothetical protein QRY74_00505 [Chlamydia sp.]
MRRIEIKKIGIAVFCLFYMNFSAIDAVGAPSQKNEQMLSVKDSITIDNQILATVRDHVITVLDLVKKMDMIFYRQYPEYRSSPEARLQFYQTHWRAVLKEAIDRQLAFAYAEEKKFEVSRADIRQELEELFGPDVMLNLYENGLQIYDVESMLEADILMRQLLLYAVKMPVLSSITPQDLHKEYERRCATQKTRQKNDEEWVWRSFTISRATSKGKELSPTTIEKIISSIKAVPINSTEVLVLESDAIEITPSAPFTSHRSTIANQVADQMESLSLGTPTPLVQVQSRKEGLDSWRSYVLLSKRGLARQEEDFRSQEAQIREEIASQLIEEKTAHFFSDLEKQYGVHIMLSDQELESFQPFQLNRTS